MSSLMPFTSEARFEAHQMTVPICRSNMQTKPATDRMNVFLSMFVHPAMVASQISNSGAKRDGKAQNQ